MNTDCLDSSEFSFESQTLCDMHCHLGFLEDPYNFVQQAALGKTWLFSNTVQVREWEHLRNLFFCSTHPSGNTSDCGVPDSQGACYENLCLGFGMHPWWVKAQLENAETSSVDALTEYLVELLNRHKPYAIGEVGLDFGWRHAESAHEQTIVLRAILKWAAGTGERLISLHGVKASKELLDELVQTGVTDSCACVLHWFTGPSDLLKQAIELGCYFSCGPRMLKTGKGREYIKAIPVKQLLLETDLPASFDSELCYASLRAELELAARQLAAIKGKENIAIMQENSLKLLRGAKSFVQ